MGRPGCQVAGVTAEAYTRLRALIVSGGLAPGAPLIETDLSVRLGVSRTPVRAAVQRLQQEGFVAGTKVGHMFRAVVAPLTADDMRELHFMLGALEGVAVRRAAEFSEDVRTALANGMEAINVQLRVCSQGARPHVREAQDLHVKFHRCCVEAAAGRRLLTQLDSLQPQVERYERFYTGALISGHRFEAALLEHDRIVEAIRVGDAVAAERAVAANWRNGADRYGPIVELLGERGSW
ncbi:MAG: GntR family transcriptional regulator [Bacteroidales bacterium]